MIDTILFDMGGTLEDIVNTEKTAEEATAAVENILKQNGLSPALSGKDLQQALVRGLKTYDQARGVHNVEMKPEIIWPEYMLKEAQLDAAAVAGISEELAHAWEVTYFTRRLRPGAKQMLNGLKALGMKLGIVSNTASLYQVFAQLEQYGIRQYFADVTLSSQIGYRKPHPGIFRVALLQMQSQAKNSIYVGDTVSRDVRGARNAGFAYAIQILSKLTKEKDEKLKNVPEADFVVATMDEVYQVCRSIVSNS